jgi:hypothetical protein
MSDDTISRQALQKSDPANKGRGGLTRSLGLGVITGAADDDCSAIGTYASAG